MTIWSRAALAAGLVVGVLGSLPAHAQFFGPPRMIESGGFDSVWGFDINNAGDIVGQADQVGFVYSGGVFTTVRHPDTLAPDNRTTLTGITGDRSVLVGTYVVDARDDGTYRVGSFLKIGDEFQSFTLPFDVPELLIRKISEDGRYLTGVYRLDMEKPYYSAFVFDRETSSLVTFSDPDRQEYFLQGVNSHGIVVGSFRRRADGDKPRQHGGLIYDTSTGVLTEVMYGSDTFGYALRDINDAGLMAGMGGFSGVVGDGTTWQRFDPPPDQYQAWAYSLNDNGQLLGFYTSWEGVDTTWRASAVPEAGAPWQWAMGLGGLWLVLRRQPYRGRRLQPPARTPAAARSNPRHHLRGSGARPGFA
jgi:hypothetical protein